MNGIRFYTNEAGKDALFIARHHLQALRMRQTALEAQNWTWWVASTYALSQSWEKTRKAVPWFQWGCESAMSDTQLQAVTLLVGAHGALSEEQAKAAGKVMNPTEPEKPFARAASKKLIVLEAGFYRPGPKSPTPGEL